MSCQSVFCVFFSRGNEKDIASFAVSVQVSLFCVHSASFTDLLVVQPDHLSRNSAQLTVQYNYACCKPSFNPIQCDLCIQVPNKYRVKTGWNTNGKYVNQYDPVLNYAHIQSKYFLPVIALPRNLYINQFSASIKPMFQPQKSKEKKLNQIEVHKCSDLCSNLTFFFIW